MHVDISPAMTTRKRDISSWIKADLRGLGSRGRKRYHKRKAAIVDYFTSDDSLNEIALRHHMPPEVLLNLAEKCLMQHEDGMPWGFRALVPGITVIDYSPPSTSSTEEETLDLATGEMATSVAEENFPDAEIEEEIAINRAPMEENELPGKSNAQLIVRPNLMPTVLPLYGKGRKRVDVKKLARTRRSVRKRWIHDMQDERRRKRFHRLVSTSVVAALLVLVLLPLGTGLAAYSAYNSIRGVALDGVNYLLTVKNLIPVSKSDPTAALDPHKLLQARSDLSKAQSDFLQLQQLVNRPDVHSAVDQFVPQYSGELGMVQRLAQVGIDVSRLGDEAIGVALLGANIVHGSPLASGSTKPLITAADIANVEGVLVHGQYYLDDIRAQMSQISVNRLPISAAQQKQFTSLMALLPRVQSLFEQGQGLVGIVSWLLGVGQPRHYLVQTMDNAELRPGGGFTGIYGLLTIHDGRMAPFSLQDVTVLDYASNGTEINRQAPPAYRSWMNFGNFGLRDSNISADYPTSARLNLQIFQEEGGGPVDGDIALTPKVISHILNVIGPIKVPQYNEIITAQNLEDKLHYYQQDFGAIAREKQISGNYSHAGRKAC